MFTTKVWQTGFAQVVGLLAFAAAIVLVLTGAVAWPWLLAMPVSYYILAASGSVGLHFLFCHRAWRAPRAAVIGLGLAGTLLCIGSPLQWAVGHALHHLHSDTALDPHNAATWRGLFLGRYVRPKVTRKIVRQVRWLRTDKFLGLLHDYSVVWIIGFCVLLALISWKLLLFAYLAPLGIVMLAGAVHNVISHNFATAAVDLHKLRWLYPFEWSHGSHHERPRDMTVSPAAVAVAKLLGGTINDRRHPVAVRHGDYASGDWLPVPR